MRVDASLPGLGKPGSRTSVVVLDQAVANKTAEQGLAEISAAFAGDSAKAQGLEMREPRQSTVAGFPALTTTGIQRIQAGTFSKVVVAMVADGRLVLMTGTIQQDDPLSADALLDTLTAARWNKQAAPGGFGFDITAAPGYQRTESSGGLLYSLGSATGTTAPKLIVAPSLGQTAIPAQQRREFAVSRFGSLPSAPKPNSTTEVTIDGLPGFELVGKGSDGRTAYSVVLYPDNGYIVLVGDFDPATHPGQLSAFRAMANSLVRE
jgi:hypothetical protein